LTALCLLDRIPGDPGRADRWHPATGLLDLLTAIQAPLTPNYLSSNVRGYEVNE
jgi:hypothetical protein